MKKRVISAIVAGLILGAFGLAQAYTEDDVNKLVKPIIGKTMDEAQKTLFPAFDAPDKSTSTNLVYVVDGTQSGSCIQATLTIDKTGNISAAQVVTVSCP